VLGQQFANILGRTDPFDVAQGLERHIRMMQGAEIRMLIQAAAPRMNDWYRSEFLPLINEMDEDRLRAAFAHSLKSNLRAIPLFGSNFCEGVIAKIPGDRTVGLGEEGRAFRMRPVAFAVIALALLIGGAAAEHVFSNARANANTPVVLVTPAPASLATPVPMAAATPVPATPVPVKTQPVRRAARRAVSKPAPQPVAAPPPTAAPAPVVAQAPVAVPPVHRVFTSPPRLVRTPPPGSGVKTIVAQEPRRTPVPEATPVDTSDMPQAYSDATPLPANAPPPAAEVNTAVRVPTPTPEPNHSWTHRLVHAAVHLVNSTLSTVGVAKKPSQPTPSASPPGPQPR
jgi:hypothetical protein